MSYRVYHQGKHLERLQAILDEVKGPGSGRFADGVKARLVAGNRDDRLRGVDRRGRPLAARTSARTGKYKGAAGPTLAPFDEKSDAIAGYFADVTRKAAGWTLRAGIRSAKAIIFAFHAQGKGRYGPVPVRDILGTTPRTQASIRALFREWAAGRFKSRGYRG